MKKVIVTGATGFIGSAFVGYLIKKKIDVIALGRKKINDINRSTKKKIEGAKYLNIDMDEIYLLETELKKLGWSVGVDCVFFNLAWGGESGLSDLNVRSQMKNVARSVAALEVAKKIGCSRFIQVGTMEEAFTQKYLLLNHHNESYYNRHVIYSIAKIAAKNALTFKASQLGMDFNYVLHSHVMGPDDDKNSFLQVLLQNLISGKDLIFSTGEQYFDVVSIEDCCLGYELICQKGRPSIEYWVGSGEPQRLKNYIERMYALFPSGLEMQFGKMPFNDVVLEKEVFSIATLHQDTGYRPTLSYEECVIKLHDYLINLNLTKNIS